MVGHSQRKGCGLDDQSEVKASKAPPPHTLCTLGSPCGLFASLFTMTSPPAYFVDYDLPEAIVVGIQCLRCGQPFTPQGCTCPEAEESQSSIHIQDLDMEDPEDSVCTGCGGVHCYCSEYEDDGDE